MGWKIFKTTKQDQNQNLQYWKEKNSDKKKLEESKAFDNKKSNREI